MNTIKSGEQDAGAALARLARYFETLTPQTVPLLTTVYAADASFKDPFNDIRGHAAIVRVFEHMFVQLQEPRFRVLEQLAQGRQGFLTWELDFRFQRWPKELQCIRGATHVRFNEDGLVQLHRDYWDAAEELYEKLPLLGGMMRMLKRSANR